MTAWTSDQLKKSLRDGSPLQVVVYETGNVSPDDTIDVSADFATPLAASLAGIRNSVAVTCPIVSGRVTIPLIGQANLFPEAGWITVLGVGK